MKGKIFDTRFGLIHVQTGGKNFCQGTSPPPPPPPPPPPGIAKNCCGHAAGGMPLAFTQEDFFVRLILISQSFISFYKLVLQLKRS